MGNSLHNKIQLGRRSAWNSRTFQAVLALGTATAVALGWLAMQLLR